MILDRKLPDGTAEDPLAASLRNLAPDAAVLIVTGYGDIQGAIAALRQGAADYILKPDQRGRLYAPACRRRIADRRRRRRCCRSLTAA